MGKKSSVGRPRKYPLNSLEIGQSFMLRWTDENRKDLCLVAKRFRYCVEKESQRYRKRFKCELLGNSRSGGILVTRTA